MRRLFYVILLLLAIHPLFANIRFLTISDIHYGIDCKSGDGNDTDNILLTSAMNKLSLLVNQVDFIITLGDFPKHMLGHYNKKESYIKAVFHALYQADRTDVPMFYVFGNNDSLFGNYQPFSLNGKSPLTLATDWQGACVHCEGLIIDGTHMYEEGYYSTYVLPGNKDILLIVLNSSQFVKIPFFSSKYPNQSKDAQKQLLWLEKQLKNNTAKQLLIAMHVPPGTSYKGKPIWQEPFLKQFIHLLNIANPNYGQISLLTGHTHMDDIRRIHLNSGKNIYAYATPSISRVHHNNSAMKIFELNSDLKIQDYTTYYTTLNESWKNEHYSALKGPNNIFSQCHKRSLADCLSSLSPQSICNIFQNSQCYGVKSMGVDNTACKLTYPIN